MPGRGEKKGRKGRRNRLRAARGRGTLEKEKPPIFGMIQRGGQVVIRMLPNVKQDTIKPIITEAIAADTLVYTDEYAIYSKLKDWGYGHKSVCHGDGEYAQDEDNDGFHEVHVNTMEGFWSLLRSWLRPHRGYHKRNFRCISVSSSVFTTLRNAVRRLYQDFWRCCLGNSPEPIKSQRNKTCNFTRQFTHICT